MSWETRMHWLWGLVLPGRWYVLLTMLGLACLLTAFTWGIIAGLVMLAISGFGFSVNWFEWHNLTLAITRGERTMWERRGFAMTSERRINLGMAGSMQFCQTPMGRLLDYGTLSIVALGGPYEWENIGNFRTLRRIIESNCEWMPQQRVVIRVAMRERLSLWGVALRRSWDTFMRWWRRRPRRIQVINRSIYSPYERFLNYAADYIFPRSVFQFEAVSGLSGASAPESTLVEERIFWHILKLRHVLISDSGGRICRHPRIRSIQDIQNRIPAEWFNRYFQQYHV